MFTHVHGHVFRRHSAVRVSAVAIGGLLLIALPLAGCGASPSNSSSASATSAAASSSAAPEPDTLGTETSATPEPTKTPKPDKTPEPDRGPDLTVSQENARESAESYLSFSAFSRSGLIDQLEFEGFSKADATAAVDSIDVDWNEQAAKSAENYLEFSSFSRSGLVDQLEFEGFTSSQAEYGVSVAFGEAGAGGGEEGSGGDNSVTRQNAIESAESYLSFSAFSRSGLIDQLEFEGYSNSDATYAVDSLDVNWNEQAAKSAESYLELSSFSRSGLIDQLVFEGFTRSQAEYGVSAVGL